MYEKLLFNSLSEREREVFYLVAKGYTNKEIAEECFISLETVKSHIQMVFKKLHLHHRTQVAIYAFVNKIIEWDKQEGRLLCQKR